jgi:hypothetical protein
MYIGDKSRVNISSSKFSNFINNGYLYVDKTAFIEHVLQNSSDVLLFTRPRRMGKSLNMDTLATFLDCKQDTAHLFKGLYIKSTSEFSKIIATFSPGFAAFTSSSAVERFTEAAGNVDFQKIKAICIGERTAATAQSYGMEIFISEKATIDSLITKVEEVMKEDAAVKTEAAVKSGKTVKCEEAVK